MAANLFASLAESYFCLINVLCVLYSVQAEFSYQEKIIVVPSTSLLDSPVKFSPRKPPAMFGNVGVMKPWVMGLFNHTLLSTVRFSNGRSKLGIILIIPCLSLLSLDSFWSIPFRSTALQKWQILGSRLASLWQ